ncbi:retinal pigment epithelial membrane family protein [Mycobacterium xenopi 3993]|nr:retinal pigment epithelial membrane family protein [Mycobacterium xenopi 3993]
MSYSFARGNTVQYSVIDVQGRVRRTVDIDVGGSPAMHDFSLTDNYVVVYDLPVTFDPVQVLPVKVPRWLGLPARLVLQSLIGRVPTPSPITARINRNPSAATATHTRGIPGIKLASGSCPATATTPTSAGSTSSLATCSTRSTPTRKSVTAPRSSSSTSCAMTGCSSVTCAAPATAAPPWTAGRSTWPAVR